MDKLFKMKPYEEQLDSLFVKYFEKLENSPLIKLSGLKDGELPKTGGLYVFYEDKEKPIYVGRTKNIRQRIQLHTRASSKNESATFTFNLAKMQYKIEFPEKKETTRTLLMNEEDFIQIFKSQKEKVKNMYLKYIIEDHDILQTMLEPYLAFKLKTYPVYNKFETH